MISVLVLDNPELNAEALARTLTMFDDLTAVTPRPDETIFDAVFRWRAPVAVVGELNGGSFTACGDITRQHPDGGVLRLVDQVTGDLVAAAMRAGCSGLVDRSGSVAQLVAAIRTVADGGTAFPAAAVVDRLSRHQQGLSGRELEVLSLIDQGHTTQAIAQQLLLSHHTVRNHVQRLFQKLDAHSRIEALAIARRLELLPAVAA